MTSQCQQIKKEYQAIKALKTEFVLEYDKALQTGNLTKAKELKAKLEEKRNELKEKVFIKEIKAIWENPQNLESKEIVINIDEHIERSKKLYQETLGITINEKEFKRIWLKNRKEIQKEMATYGYDTILLVPDNLPDLATLNRKLIETMEDFNPRTSKIEKVAETQEWVKLSSIKSFQESKNRIVLTKNVQNVVESQDPILEATLNKNIFQLLGLPNATDKAFDAINTAEVQKRAKSGHLEMNFKQEITDKNGKKKEISIKADGLSLQEYIIFQRQYFEQYGKHLDERGWAWLLKSLFGARLARSGWGPVGRRLCVGASDTDDFDDDLGVRLSCSFSL